MTIDPGDRIKIASLVVSIATLLVLMTILLAVTVAQISYGSAYLPRWDRRILGEWAHFARRRLRLHEMRFETEFEVPFIFLSPANTSRGPLPGRDIIYIDGTTESYERTRVRLPSDTQLARKDATDERHVTGQVGLEDPQVEFGIVRSVEWHSNQRANRRYRDAVPVVANERVTWIPLLEALQEMERDSTHWEASVWQRPELVDVTSLVAGIQIGRRVLDPTSVIKKPYATTNMSSIVALAAVLGLYWKQFDRDQDVYRAEGNSFVLRGSRIPHFEKTGNPKFSERRLIPTSAVHELCFGRVPTIYRDEYSYDPTSDITLGNGKSEGPSFIQTLRLGSRKDIAVTLTQIGCNQKTAYAHSTRGGDDQILLPLSFQIMAMLGQVFYVKNRGFTYLPNPTTTPWPKYLIALRPMLTACKGQLGKTLSALQDVPRDLELLEGIVRRLEGELPSRDQHFSPPQMALLYDSLTRLDDILMKAGGEPVLDVVCRHIEAWIDESYWTGLNSDLVPPEDIARIFVAHSFEAIRERAIDQGSSFGPTKRNIVWCTLFTRMLCWLLLHNFDENDVQVAKSELIGSREEVHIL